MKAFVTVGLPGSGKSTWAKQHVSENPTTTRINNDDIRNGIYREAGHRNWSHRIEQDVKTARETLIQQCASCQQDVIIDNTHINPKTRSEMIDFCKKNGFEVEIVDFRHVPIEECILRDSKREGYERVGEKVIRDMQRKFMKSVESRGLPEWTKVHEEHCIIVDVDGTLAHMGDRNPFDETMVYNDTVREHVRDTIHALLNHNPNMKLFVFSGRSDSCKLLTDNWLRDKCGFDKFELMMRSTGDTRRDSFVKTDLYNLHIKGKYNVFAVFDDRPQVLRECWAVLNLPVFNCGVIDVEF